MINKFQNIAHIKKIKSVIYSLNNQRIKAEIDELSEKVTSEKFYLVMLGLFKRGKSSLINALLKDEIVPTGVIPLTAIITLIEYSSKKYAKIFYNNSECKIVNIDEISQYVAEKENPKNIKKVSHIIIYHDSEILKSVTIIDTPGVGSSLEHNTETTNQFIDKIDAALFILSVDVPITKAETEFLAGIKMRVPKIIFVLNKIDLFTDEQLDEAEDYNRNVLNEICDKKPIEIIRVSSRNALFGYQQKNQEIIEASKIGSLLKRINLLTDTEKESIIYDAITNRLILLTNETISLIKFRVETLKMPSQDLEEKLKQFRSLMNVMKNEKGDFDILMEGRSKQLQDHVAETVNGIGHKLIDELDDSFAADQKHLLNRMKEENLAAIQEEFIKQLKNSFDEMKSGLENNVVEEFKNILIKYGNGSNEFMSKLLNSLGSMFNFDISLLSEKFDLKAFTSFYYNFETEPAVLGLNSGLLRSKMPKLVIEKLVFNKMRDSLISKINSNCGRVIYDITYRIQESFIKFKFDINNKHEKILDDLEKILNNTLNKKQLTEQNIESELKRLEEKLNELVQIKNEIENV